MKNPLILLFLAIFSVSNSFTQSVTIGTQVWTTKNLDAATFRNGDLIPEAKTDEEWIAAGKNKQPAWCYYENDIKNGTKYGKLYNWYAVVDARGLAPAGWHVPTDEEWTLFLDRDGAGKRIKSTSGWLENGNGTNSSGFSGLPGGCRDSDGDFSGVGYGGSWWSVSEANAKNAWGRALNYDDSNLRAYLFLRKRLGFSVRCVKD